MSRCMFALVGALALLSGCLQMPKAKEQVPLETIDYAEVYRQAIEAIQPAAEVGLRTGDRVLLVGTDQFYGNHDWRFVPTDMVLESKQLTGEILPAVKAAHAQEEGGGDEQVKYVRSLFPLRRDSDEYQLDTKAQDFSELRLGRILSQAGYSAVEPFDSRYFFESCPYFLDYLENGFISAILANRGTGYERLALADLDGASEQKHNRGELVFNTLMLAYNNWKDIADEFQVNKMLVYSVNSVVQDGTTYIGMQLGLQLLDVSDNGRVLWEGVRTTVSDDFPAGEMPQLSTVALTLPEASAQQETAKITDMLEEEDADSPARAILIKVDDIPIFGNYPITREDFAVETSLASFFSRVEGIDVVAKLSKRQYKRPWQLVNAVYYTTPLLSGEYGQFTSYYKARYLITYRVLWRDQQGIQIVRDGQTFELQDKVLGFYYRVIDMADEGRILVSSFFPIAAEAELGQSVLYRCYRKTADLEQTLAILAESGALSEEEKTVVLNRRMEIVSNYIVADSERRDTEETLVEDFLMRKRGSSESAVMFDIYHPVYDLFGLFDEEEEPVSQVAAGAGWGEEGSAPEQKKDPCDQTRELMYTIAAQLMQSWFEDGLCTALRTAGVNVCEKLESLYSRYLLLKTDPDRTMDQELYLSPLFLQRWGPSIKSYYDIDKILYYSLLEGDRPETGYMELASPCPITQYFPILSFDPQTLLLSVVNVSSGAYVYNQNHDIK